MSMTLDELMERVKSKDEGVVMAYVRDAFHKMATLGYTTSKVKKYNIIDDKVHYDLPDEALNILKISVLYASNETELITTAIDRTFTGGSTNWEPCAGGCTGFNETTDLSMAPSGSIEGVYLDQDDLVAAGHRYRLTYDCTLTSGALELQMYSTAARGTKLGDFKNGTGNIMEFEVPEDATTTTIQIMATADGIDYEAEADFDNFSLMEVGLNEYKRARKAVGKFTNSWYDEEEGN